MPESSSTKRILPAHIEDTVEAIASLHIDHFHRATSQQRLVERLTRGAGRPEFVGALTVAVCLWIVLNLGMVFADSKPIDAPPFFWLQGCVALGALYMTLLILVTQRREDQLASRREQLTLELAILSEQKSAKIIELLEELRRDHPLIVDRTDHEATAMSTPTDPQAVFDAIAERHLTVEGSASKAQAQLDGAEHDR